MKEKNIRELARRMGLVTVEDMCQYTITQLVVKIANKVNELVNEVWRFESDVQEILKTQNENIQYLLGEGLHLEVENIFDVWVQDGTFDTLLNQSALKKVNDRIDETNAQLSVKAPKSDIDDLQTQVNNLVINASGDSNPEVVQARGEYSTLNDRICDFDNYPFSKNATLNKFDKNLIKFLSIRNADVNDIYYISNTRKMTGNGERQLTIRNISGSVVFNYASKNDNDGSGGFIEPTGNESLKLLSGDVECVVVINWNADVTEKNNWTSVESELSPLCIIGFDNLEIVSARKGYSDLNARLNDFDNYPFASNATLKNINKNSINHLSIINANLTDRFYISQLRKMTGNGERWLTIKDTNGNTIFNYGTKNSTDNNGDYIAPTGYEKICKTTNGVTVNVVINWDVDVFERNDYTLEQTEISKSCYINIPTSSSAVVESGLEGKRMIALGDSIMWGGGNNGVGIADLIANKYNMSLEKLAISGSTMADCAGRGIIYKQIDNATMQNPDFILINGGYNDVNNTSVISLGEIYQLKGTTMPDNDCYTNFDTTSYCGAFETLMRKLIDKYPTAKVIFITTPKIGNTFYDRTDNSRPYTYKDVYDKTIEGCNKWGVSVVDLYNGSRLTTASQLRNLFNAYIPDNIHPNEDGYNIFFLPQIIAKMKELI